MKGPAGARSLGYPPVAQRRHHYENAFEHYLRAKRIPYVSVDEARKALLPDGAALSAPAPDPDAPRPGLRAGRALKSFDFVVYGEGTNLLLDIKGRKVARKPGGASAARSRLDSWATQDDIDSLLTWRRLFGAGFDAALVFVYWCDDQPPDGLFQEVFAHRERWYAVRTVLLDAYLAAMKTRSAKWRTVHVPVDEFERISQPFCGSGGGPGGDLGLGHRSGPRPRAPSDRDSTDAGPRGALQPRTGPISSG